MSVVLAVAALPEAMPKAMAPEAPVARRLVR
jgi:hypothetical protein